jgi:DNA-directed RNA polymerase specialized sigma24 family protein
MVASCAAPMSSQTYSEAARQARLQADAEAAFRDVLAHSLAGLELCDRNLITFHHVHSLSVDQLAEMFCRPRAAVVRQLGRIRERLLREIDRGLAARLVLTRPELERLLDLARSHLDHAITRLLRRA